MTLKNDAPAGCDPARGCCCLKPCVACDCSEPARQVQLPRMGSALRAFLRRYRDDLGPLAEAGDRVAAGMVDCCTALLVEADRIEGGLL